MYAGGTKTAQSKINIAIIAIVNLVSLKPFQSRTTREVDISALEKRYPDLARSFVTLRDQLDAPLLQGGADAEATDTYIGTAQRFNNVL